MSDNSIWRHDDLKHVSNIAIDIMARILVISDSRGRGIKHLLEEQTPHHWNIVWEVQVLSGATLETIRKKVERGQRRSNWDCIIVIAGICNITRRKARGQNRYLEYKERKVVETIEAIDKLIDSLGNININICTITPASLKDYSEVRNNDPELETEQKQLEEDITEINKHIIERNIRRDQTTVNLAKLSQIRSLKKQGQTKKRIIKFNTKSLTDGVHPTVEHLREWATYIKDIIHKLLKTREPSEHESSQDDTSESEPEDTGNFKRQRRT